MMSSCIEGLKDACPQVRFSQWLLCCSLVVFVVAVVSVFVVAVVSVSVVVVVGCFFVFFLL